MTKRAKSSRRKDAKRREGKQHAPRVTPFPLPPTPIPVPIPWHDMARLQQQALARNDFLAQILGGVAQSEHLLPKTRQRDYRPFARCAIRTTCMMERERWA